MKNIKSALLALAFVSGIAATLICSTPALADKALEGDQHTAALSQSMDEVSYAWILFTRSLSESRPVEEVAHSTEILADAFDRMCAHLIQFSIWSQTMKPSDFSASGLAQLDRIKADTAQLKQQLQLSRSLIEKFNSYANDPRVAAAGNRVVDASTTLAKFAPRQDAPSQDPVLNPEALRRLNEAAGAN